MVFKYPDDVLIQPLKTSVELALNGCRFANAAEGEELSGQLGWIFLYIFWIVQTKLSNVNDYATSRWGI